jgi:hypothetical protein
MFEAHGKNVYLHLILTSLGTILIPPVQLSLLLIMPDR